MSTPLLATKFYPPPPPPTLVRRARLCERLNGGLHRKLTLISAPAGFGKTTLVSEWIAATERPVAWLSLDTEEGEISRFCTYLIGALQRVAPAIGKGLLETLLSPQPPAVDLILTTLLNEIATLSESLLLVLDDYHLVEASAVDSALTFLLDHLPPQLHLVITTREDPNLPLARWRVSGQLTEIRAGDLRFTADEAANFLNQTMALNLTADAVTALEARTEGWIAGLQLAAISMQSHPVAGENNRADFIDSFTGSHRFVMDYLVEEVLEQQPPARQRFLLQTSILDRFCGPLCDAILQDVDTDGQAALEALEQANLFLIPLDNERRWYRYHHLFAQLLRQKRQQQGSGSATKDDTDDTGEIHRRAAIWFEESNLPFDALRHALAAKDFARAAGLLEQTWRDMDDSRRTTRWLDWVQQLPEALIRARPVLCAAYGWALLESGALDAADAYLHHAEEWLVTIADQEHQPQAPETGVLITDEEEFCALPATIAAARTYYALTRNDLRGTKRYARRALDLIPVDNHLRRGVPAVLLGLAYWTDGELDLAYRTFGEGVESFRLAGNLLFAVTGAYVLADIKRAQGGLQAAIQIYQQWLQLAADQNQLIRRGVADIYTGLSEVACEQGKLDVAMTYLQQSAEWGEHTPLPRWRCRWSLAQACVHQAQGELDAALTMLDEAAQTFLPGPVPDVRPIAARKARIWVMQGNLADATAWAQAVGLTAADELSYLREFEHITLARLLIAQYRSDKEAHCIAAAMALLTRLLSAAEEGGRMGSAVEILMLQALAREAQDDLIQACSHLERALRLAEPEGYCRLFLNEGPPMARLLAAASAENLMPDYVATLRAALGTNAPPVNSPAPQVPSVSSPSAQPLIEPLSERELEVLQLVAQGLSNREIAERLFLALSTVKGHNRVIYGKLQVQRRTEAVARAQELGLL